MANLFSALQTAGNSLRVFEQSIENTQNNVSNASAPGYVKQTLALESLPFDLTGGSPGGVKVAGISSSRSQFAEGEVRRQNESLGSFSEQSTYLDGISSLFDVSGASGIPASLTSFFQSLSAWGVAPNSPAARQAVLDGAAKVASTFRQAADGINSTANDIDNQLDNIASQINAIGANLATLNAERTTGSQDPALDAKIYSNLEQLSGLVNFSVLYPANGAVTVLIGGQVPLVIGSNHFDIQSVVQQPATPPPVYPAGPPSARILNADGDDVTSLVTGGKVGGLLSVRNGLIASLRGDTQQVGDLNTLAKKFADRVNGILTAGRISDGPPPVSGVPLFSYAADPNSTARSLSVTNITPDQLAAIQPGPPSVSNGVILQLAGLANSANPTDQVNGSTYAQYFGLLAGRVGQQQNAAQDGVSLQTQAVALARNQRQQISGVSLDEEATRLIELQRSYQAAAQMVTIINSLTGTLMTMLS